MKTLLRSLVLIFLLATVISCSDDPCEDANNVECESQDYDGDGVLNGDDEAPKDACIPNMPTYEENVVGTWDYNLILGSGTVRFNADGTYEDINNVLVSNGTIEKREWSISLFGGIIPVLNIDVYDESGWSAGLTLRSFGYDCDELKFDGQGLGDIIFTRVE